MAVEVEDIYSSCMSDLMYLSGSREIESRPIKKSYILLLIFCWKTDQAVSYGPVQRLFRSLQREVAPPVLCLLSAVPPSVRLTPDGQQSVGSPSPLPSSVFFQLELVSQLEVAGGQLGRALAAEHQRRLLKSEGVTHRGTQDHLDIGK